MWFSELRQLALVKVYLYISKLFYKDDAPTSLDLHC